MYKSIYIYIYIYYVIVSTAFDSWSVSWNRDFAVKPWKICYIKPYKTLFCTQIIVKLIGKVLLKSCIRIFNTLTTFAIRQKRINNTHRTSLFEQAHMVFNVPFVAFVENMYKRSCTRADIFFFLCVWRKRCHGIVEMMNDGVFYLICSTKSHAAKKVAIFLIIFLCYELIWKSWQYNHTLLLHKYTFIIDKYQSSFYCTNKLAADFVTVCLFDCDTQCV